MRGEVDGADRPDPVRPGRGRPRGHGRHAGHVLVHRRAQALEAAEALAAEGIDAEVIDLRTVCAARPRRRSTRRCARPAARSCSPTRRPSAACSPRSRPRSRRRCSTTSTRRSCASAAAHAPIPHAPPLFEALVPSLDSVSAALREIVGVTV